MVMSRLLPPGQEPPKPETVRHLIDCLKGVSGIQLGVFSKEARGGRTQNAFVGLTATLGSRLRAAGHPPAEMEAIIGVLTDASKPVNEVRVFLAEHAPRLLPEASGTSLDGRLFWAMSALASPRRLRRIPRWRHPLWRRRRRRRSGGRRLRSPNGQGSDGPAYEGGLVGWGKPGGGLT